MENRKLCIDKECTYPDEHYDAIHNFKNINLKSSDNSQIVTTLKNIKRMPLNGGQTLRLRRKEESGK